MGCSNGLIYLISCADPDGTRFKIGFTTSVSTIATRLRNVQTGNPYPCVLEYKYETKHGRRVESILHRKFSCCRLHGEWFDMDFEQAAGFISLCECIERGIDVMVENDNPYCGKF